MLLRRAARSLLWSGAACLLPAIAGAQGFALNEIGSCAISRGFAATAGGCMDASLIFWNPAGAASLGGFSALAGVSVIDLNGKFVRDTTRQEYESTAPTAVVPNLFLNKQMMAGTRKWSVGAGVYVPYGLTSQWSDTFPGRFASRKAALQTIYAQPNIAVQLNDKWSIGGGPIYAWSKVELEQGVDLSTQTAIPGVTFAQLGIPKYTEFAVAHIEGTSSGWGGTVGIMGKLNDSWTIGARYLTAITIKYDNGDATFTQTNTGLVTAGAITGIPAGTSIDALVAPQFTGGALVAQNVSTEIVHPDQAQVGIKYTGRPDWNVEFDYQWTGWKKFDELPVNFTNTALSRTLIEDYNNSSAFRLSAEKSFENMAKLRAGIAGATTAAPEVTVSPLLPEQERGYFTIGGAWPVTANLVLDGGYARITTPGRRGRLDERPSRTIPASALNAGVYSLSANIFSLSLKLTY